MIFFVAILLAILGLGKAEITTTSTAGKDSN